MVRSLWSQFVVAHSCPKTRESVTQQLTVKINSSQRSYPPSSGQLGLVLRCLPFIYKKQYYSNIPTETHVRKPACTLLLGREDLLIISEGEKEMTRYGRTNKVTIFTRNRIRTIIDVSSRYYTSSTSRRRFHFHHNQLHPSICL